MTTLSAPVKITRTADLVERTDLDPLLNLLHNHGISEHQAFGRIGYKSPSSKWSEIMRLGLAKRLDMYGLMGLIAELKLTPTAPSKAFSLDLEETELVFDALRKAKEIWPKRIERLKSLISRVALHLAEL